MQATKQYRPNVVPFQHSNCLFTYPRANCGGGTKTVHRSCGNRILL